MEEAEGPALAEPAAIVAAEVPVLAEAEPPVMVEAEAPVLVEAAPVLAEAIGHGA